MKRDREIVEWLLRFHHTNSLRTLIDVVSNVITRVNIKICSGPAFSGIKVESVDPRRVCLVAAKLACHVEGDSIDCDTSFCVDTATLSTCLKAVASNYSIDLSKNVEQEEIIMRSYELIQNSFCSIFTLPTLAHDCEKVELTEIDHNYIVDFDLGTLRTIVKNCIALKGENISFCVEAPKSTCDRNGLTIRKTRLTVRSEGNAEQKHIFKSVTEQSSVKDGTIIKANESTEIKETDFEEEMTVWYDETFAASYLSNFMKNMEKNSVTLRLSPEMPMVMSYALDSEGSSICFVLAVKTKE